MPSHAGPSVADQVPAGDNQASAPASNGSDTPLTPLASSPPQDPGDTYAPTPPGGPSDETNTPVPPRAAAPTASSSKGGKGMSARGSTSKAAANKKGTAPSGVDVAPPTASAPSADPASKSKRPRPPPKRAQLQTDESFFASPTPPSVKITLKLPTKAAAPKQEASAVAEDSKSGQTNDAVGKSRKNRRQSAIEPPQSEVQPVEAVQAEPEAPQAGPSHPAIPTGKSKANKKRKSEAALETKEALSAEAPTPRVAKKRGMKRVESPDETAEGEEPPAPPADSGMSLVPTQESAQQASEMDVDTPPAPVDIPEEASARPRKRPKRIIASPTKAAGDEGEHPEKAAQAQSELSVVATGGSADETTGGVEASTKTPKLDASKSQGAQPAKSTGGASQPAATASSTPKPNAQAGPSRPVQRIVKKPAPPKAAAPATSMLSQTLQQLHANSSKATPVKKDDKAEQKRKRDAWSDEWVLTCVPLLFNVDGYADTQGRAAEGIRRFCTQEGGGCKTATAVA